VKLVVSDASPLIVIAKSGLIPVLIRLVEEIIIPDAVYAECTVDIAMPGAQVVRIAVENGQIQVRPDIASQDDAPGDELAGLGAGERAAIHMAAALECPVLMDERLGRQVAKCRGHRRGRQRRAPARCQETRPDSRRGANPRSGTSVGLFPVGERGQSHPRTRRRSMTPSRQASLSCRAGSPPTVWWLLIVTDGAPMNDADSITSG
jgi:predicted nucleic acid-binding protein